MRMKNASRWMLYVLTLTVLVLGFQNCAPEMKGEEGSSASMDAGAYAALESQALNIITNRCTGCHSGLVGGTSPSLHDKAEMIAVGVVKKGNPGGSGVYTNMAAQAMPPGGGNTGAQLQVIYDWIRFMK